MVALCTGDRGDWLCWLSPVLLSTFITFTWPAAADQSDESIVVAIHQSTIVNLPGDLPGERCGTKTIVLGDLLIADIVLLRDTGGNLKVAIIGKGLGETDLVAYDCKGAKLTKKIVEVTGPFMI
jgi:Flp pilus assembly secretin CpaC